MTKVVRGDAFKTHDYQLEMRASLACLISGRLYIICVQQRAANNMQEKRGMSVIVTFEISTMKKKNSYFFVLNIFRLLVSTAGFAAHGQ